MDPRTLRRHIDALAERDRHVADGLSVVGYPKPRVRVEGFETLLSIIVSQQISTEAAAAIMARVRSLLPDMQAGELLALPEGTLREAGLSNRKVEYAVGLAHAIQDGSLAVGDFNTLDDDEVVAQITALRGFGRWSAEIYLMFCLRRKDVFPADDLALLIALHKLKRMRSRPSPAKAREKIRHWAPYRSAGSLFLWHYYRGAPT